MVIETADVIRVGFGDAVDRVVLEHGLDAPSTPRRHCAATSWS